MDQIGPHASTSRKAHYVKRGHRDPGSYLQQSRRHLLALLPVEHPMRERFGPVGVLRQQALPAPSRLPYTDAELKNIKTRRNSLASDPDHAESYLQRSQLRKMWNANYDQAQQWEEYDQARPVMEERREYSGLPDEMFDSYAMVRRKKKKVFSIRPQDSPRMGAMDYDDDDDMVTEAGDLVDQNVDEDMMEYLEESNQRLRDENEAYRRRLENELFSPLPEGPPSPPDSDTSEPSSNEEEAGEDGHHTVTPAGISRDDPALDAVSPTEHEGCR